MYEGYQGAFTGEQIDEAIAKVRDKKLDADGVKFSDGQSFQDKYDSGQLTGPRGEVGPPGEQGLQGEQGPQGEKGDKGDTGEQGPQGEKGDKGDTGEQGPPGEQGPQGVQGPRGENGADGQSLQIVDTYETLALLEEAFPDGADGSYMIQEDEELYIWSKSQSKWVSIGKLQGPEGPEGPQGPQGIQGPVGPQGPPGEQGEQGTQGPQGIQGPQGPAGASGKSAYQGAVENGYTGTEADFYSALAKTGKGSSYTMTFTAAQWVAGSGERTITIPASTHGMSGTAVMAQFFTLKSGAYVSGTWAAVESYATIGGDNGIVLHCPESAGYAGRVVLTAISA